MKIILDASSIINLINGDALEPALQVGESRFCVGPLVLDECEQQNDILRAQIQNDMIELLDDNRVSAAAFAELQQRYELGLGETECLALAIELGATVCSDDAKARKMIGERLGLARVIGTIALLRRCVTEGLLSSVNAESKYRQMKERGGFLPNLPAGYFQQAIN